MGMTGGDWLGVDGEDGDEATDHGGPHDAKAGEEEGDEEGAEGADFFAEVCGLGADFFAEVCDLGFNGGEALAELLKCAFEAGDEVLHGVKGTALVEGRVVALRATGWIPPFAGMTEGGGGTARRTGFPPRIGVRGMLSWE